MANITVQEIQRDPLDFLHRLEAGESFVILRDEHPVAEVHPVSTMLTQPRALGLGAGEFIVPLDFDEPLPNEILKEFEGE